MENINNINEEDDNESKIKLIKQEIVDKNYNQSNFINFCLSKKENEENINNWSLEEISSLIHEFKQIENTNENDIQNIYSNGIDIKEDEEEDEIINIDNEIEEMKTNNSYNQKEENKENKEKIENKEPSRKKHKTRIKNGKFESIIKCKTLEKTILNDKNIVINIKDAKEVNGGIFSKNYISYTIETTPLGWVVERRYTDFECLRKLLIKQFPFHKVAPLFNKKIKSKRLDKNFINKRINFLNNFINSIVKNESFKTSDILLSFLSLEDRIKFENKIKELNIKIIQNNNNNIDEFKTLNGDFIMLYDEKIENYCDNIQKYLKMQDEIFIKLNNNLKLFYKNMSVVTENMNEIINNLGNLHNINSNVLMKETITNSYQGLQNLFKGWKKIVIKQNNIVKNKIKNFFKYINLNNNTYRDILEKRKELQIKFNNENNNLEFKKEKLYLYKDINKYEIYKDKKVYTKRLLEDKKYAFSVMCTHETKNIVKLHKMLGYGNKMALMELKQMIKENSQNFIETFSEFKEEFSPTIKEITEIWNKFELFLKNIDSKSRRNNNYKKNKKEYKNINDKIKINDIND